MPSLRPGAAAMRNSETSDGGNGAGAPGTVPESDAPREGI